MCKKENNAKKTEQSQLSVDATCVNIKLCFCIGLSLIGLCVIEIPYPGARGQRGEIKSDSMIYTFEHGSS